MQRYLEPKRLWICAYLGESRSLYSWLGPFCWPRAKITTVMRKSRTQPRWWIDLSAYLPLGLATAGVVGFCIYGTILSVATKGFGADAAARAQAAGTVAAISGAVWISGAEGRRERRRKRLEREETAWAVRYAMRGARNEASTVVHELFDPLTAKAENDRHWRTRCRNSRLLLQSYAGRTDHVHPGIIQDANNTILLIEELEADLEKALPYLASETPLPMKLAESLAWYEVQIGGLIERFDGRMVDIIGELDRGGDMLPIREYQARQEDRP